MPAFSFVLHLIATIGAYLFPFLVRWEIVLLVFGLVLLQFHVFGKCLMNEQHGLSEKDDTTFYSYLLESLGFEINRARLKFFVRQILYLILSGVALIWQIALGHEPILF